MSRVVDSNGAPFLTRLSIDPFSATIPRLIARRDASAARCSTLFARSLDEIQNIRHYGLFQRR